VRKVLIINQIPLAIVKMLPMLMEFHR